MRVITGTARGRKLKTLEGLDTRPTTDMVKESVFNIIQFDVEGRRFLDLFAGTGQMGIEALSRGAKYATFVDQGKAAVTCIRENVKLTGFADSCEIMQTDAMAFITRCGKYDVVFLDPPYKSNLLDKVLARIAEFDILTDGGIIVCESPVEKELPELPVPYKLKKNYRYGKIKISVFTREPQE